MKRGCAADLNRKWTDTEKQYIKDNANEMYDKELALRLSEMSGRKITIDAIRKVRQKLGVKKGRGRGLCEIQPSDNYKGVPDELRKSTYTNVAKDDKVTDRGNKKS